VRGISCRGAAAVLRKTEVVVPHTHYKRFTLGSFRCQVTRVGSISSPRPAKYVCRRGNERIWWAYHP
jgi:hypothetical protein